MRLSFFFLFSLRGIGVLQRRSAVKRRFIANHRVVNLSRAVRPES